MRTLGEYIAEQADNVELMDKKAVFDEFLKARFVKCGWCEDGLLGDDRCVYCNGSGRA